MCSLWEQSQTVVILHPSIARAMSMLVSFQVYSLTAVKGIFIKKMECQFKVLVYKV